MARTRKTTTATNVVGYIPTMLEVELKEKPNGKCHTVFFDGKIVTFIDGKATVTTATKNRLEQLGVI